MHKAVLLEDINRQNEVYVCTGRHVQRVKIVVHDDTIIEQVTDVMYLRNMIFPI
jgi:hypothetical protein